jgi:DNA-binding beta-propeller fold protein YncE
MKESQMKKLTVLMMFLMLGLCILDAAKKPMGVFVNSNTNSIQFIDPSYNSVTPNYLGGMIGSYGGGLFDVVVTNDGKTAIVSNFGDSKIFFIDISNGFECPTKLPVPVRVGMFAEDMVITPDGKYVLVADGGFSPYVTTVLLDPTFVCKNYLGANKYANSVDITPDGTVLVSDYFQGAIHAYAFASGTGTLTHLKTVRILPFRPVNTAISPDGKTVIAVTAGFSGTAILCYDPLTKDLVYTGHIAMPSRNGQSCVFNKEGDKAYYLSNSQNKGTQVIVLNVSPCTVSPSGTSIKIWPSRGTSQLFGVDTIAIDPNGNYLYVTNPTLSGGIASVAVVDLSINQQIGYIPAMGIPTGIAFTPGDGGDGE